MFCSGVRFTSFQGWFGLLIAGWLILNATGCSQLAPPAGLASDIQARMDLASSFLANDQPRRSLRHLVAVQDRAGDNPHFHYLYGLTSMQLGQTAQARQHFEQAVQLDPDNAQAWNSLGQTHISLQQPDKAERAFRQALDIPTYLSPEYPAYNLARLYLDQDKPQKAADMARQSLEYNSGFAPARLLLAQSLTDRNRIQSAVEILHQGLEITPQHARLMLALGENLLRLGRDERAKKWFERIVRTAPDSEPAQVAADYLDLLP